MRPFFLQFTAILGIAMLNIIAFAKKIMRFYNF